MSLSRVRLRQHDPSWTGWFRRESRRLESGLGSLASRVEHIGSTAVPGLIAKPIIDIGVVVADERSLGACVEPLEDLGYVHRGQHGDDPLRRYFVLEEHEKRIAQLHMWAEASPAWREALALRDLLRTRPELRSAYAREKGRAARAAGWRKNDYSVEKGPFITALLKAEGIR